VLCTTILRFKEKSASWSPNRRSHGQPHSLPPSVPPLRARRLRQTPGIYLPIYLIYVYCICMIQAYLYIEYMCIVYACYNLTPGETAHSPPPSPPPPRAPRLRPNPGIYLYLYHIYTLYIYCMCTIQLYPTYICTIYVLYMYDTTISQVKPSPCRCFHRLLRAPHTFDRLGMHLYISYMCTLYVLYNLYMYSICIIQLYLQLHPG